MFKTDQYINVYLKKYIFIFKKIHPNIITLIGLIINMLILYFRKDYKFIFYLLNILRILSDNLDGMIARYYNRTSYIGGLLDSLSDIIHIMIISYFILSDYFSYLYIFITMFLELCIIITYLINIDALSDHSNLYNRESYRYIDYIPVLISENTYLSIFILNLYFFII